MNNRKWVFKLTVHQGNDEFWEDRPSHAEVQSVLYEAFMSVGMSNYVELELQKYEKEYPPNDDDKDRKQVQETLAAFDERQELR